MTVSALFYIITPIVAVLALGGWLMMVFYADAHPEHRGRGAPLVPGSTAGDSDRTAAGPAVMSRTGAGISAGDKDAMTPDEHRGDRTPMPPSRGAARRPRQAAGAGRLIVNSPPGLTLLPDLYCRPIGRHNLVHCHQQVRSAAQG
jgi:hypothetical protein